MKIVLTICLWMGVCILSAQSSQLKFERGAFPKLPLQELVYNGEKEHDGEFLGQGTMTNTQWKQFKEEKWK
jgi:hypothetical protein